MSVTLKLPEWAEQDGGIIRVSTVAQAVKVVDYIPEELDLEFDIVITDRSESQLMQKFARALR